MLQGVKSTTAPATVSGERRQEPLAGMPGRLAQPRPASQETCHRIVTKPGRGVLEGGYMARFSRVFIIGTFRSPRAVYGVADGTFI